MANDIEKIWLKILPLPNAHGNSSLIIKSYSSINGVMLLDKRQNDEAKNKSNDDNEFKQIIRIQVRFYIFI